LGLSALLGALETAGKALAPGWVSWLAAGLGSLALGVYCVQSRKQSHPIIDLSILRFRTYRTNILGGTPLRIAIGASPFLLPLMLQIGFGLSPLASGALTVATAIGALGTRVVMKRAIHDMGFRPLLISATIMTSLFYMSYSLFSPTTPHLLMFVMLLLGGLINSLAMVAMTTLGFSDVPKPRMSHATTLSAMAQQLSLGLGVVLGASLVSATSWWHGGDAVHLHAEDFSPAFVVVGLITLLSLFSFLRLDPKEGAGLR